MTKVRHSNHPRLCLDAPARPLYWPGIGVLNLGLSGNRVEVHVRFWEAVGCESPALLYYLKACDSIAAAQALDEDVIDTAAVRRADWVEFAVGGRLITHFVARGRYRQARRAISQELGNECLAVVKAYLCG